MSGFLNPNEILNNLDLRDDMNAAEFGCGAGFFALPLAQKLKKGKVFGLDIQDEKLSVLKSRSLRSGDLKNIFPIQCDLEAPNDSFIRRNFLDAVLIPNLLFQAENKHAIIKEGARVLKPCGQLLIIDWLKGAVNPEEIKKIAGSAGLNFKKEIPAGKHHFALLFTK